jgi:8-hydroxy-5-deazaflavin:NADPH oxidoreductase
MRIVIIGAGHVGAGLGRAFAAVGHDIVFGVRDPESAKTLAALAEIAGASATFPAEAVAGADLVVFALRPVGLAATLAEIGSLDGRLVIDAMNRFDGDPLRSTTQDLVESLPGAKIAKAFNTIGAENYATARDREQRAAMLVAGDDPEAKRAAMDLAAELGFQAEDAGPLANAKVLEDMVKVWAVLAQAHGRTVGFAVSLG